MTLPYLLFHVLFVLPPLALLFARRPSLPPRRRLLSGVGLGLMATVAFLYTTPWDNYLIELGVWWYGDGVVTARVWAAPVGEYLFFVLQTVLTGTWLYHVDFDPTPVPGDFAATPRVVGALAWLSLAGAGAVMLLVLGQRWTYLGAILVWAAPIVALQWAVGGTYLLRAWRPWVVGVGVPTLYLWGIDRLAIGLGVWTISAEFSTGLKLLGLPIEEAVFFLVTNLLVVYGLVLFEWVMERWL
ncbi:lycopene cyclase domain-containing protein [Halobaculum sp. MBLA0147]|uniref:lycopene cyclase domain-containing protein n=1 Tax=Halobaculum sp. MBLA0147 TaxID=3079934 RepID=UPI003524B812